MFYAFGGSKTLVKHTFFIMILTWDIQKYWQAPTKTKKNKPLDAPNIDRHQKKKSSNYSEVDPYFLEILVFFGACAGLVHLVVCFFCACAGLVTLTSQSIDRHQKKQKKQTSVRLLGLELALRAAKGMRMALSARARCCGPKSKTDSHIGYWIISNHAGLLFEI